VLRLVDSALPEDDRREMMTFTQKQDPAGHDPPPAPVLVGVLIHGGFPFGIGNL
jgi:hypothetical protein